MAIETVTERLRPADVTAANSLLRLIEDENINLMVAGAYGHSRLGEWAFGGVTRDLMRRKPRSVACSQLIPPPVQCCRLIWIKERRHRARATVARREWSLAMKVRDVMTSPVVSIEPDSTVLEAVRIMLQRHISGLPVVDKERPPGRNRNRRRFSPAGRNRDPAPAASLARIPGGTGPAGG